MMLKIKGTFIPASFHYPPLAHLIEMTTFKRHSSVKFSSQVVAVFLSRANINS